MTMETGSGDRTLVRVGIVIGLLVVGVITIAVLGSVLADAFTQAAPVTTTVQAGVLVTVEVPEGASARSIGSSLESAGVVSQQELVRLVEREGIAAQLKPGTYNLQIDGITARPEILAADEGGRSLLTMTLLGLAVLAAALSAVGGLWTLRRRR